MLKQKLTSFFSAPKSFNTLITIATVLAVNFYQPVESDSSIATTTTTAAAVTTSVSSALNFGLVQVNNDGIFNEDQRSIPSNATTASIITESQQDKLSATSSQEHSLHFTCPTNYCDCIIKRKILEIDCSRRDYGGSNTKELNDTTRQIDSNDNNTTTASQNVISTGDIRHLILRHVTLGSTSIPSILPTLRENILNILELHHVIFEPVSFFNSQLFHSSRFSLQRLEITNARVHPSGPASDLIDNQRSLVHFSRLQDLDNVTICDSSSHLSQLIVQSLPRVVKHINIRNSSLTDLSPKHLRDLSALKSLDLSHNNLKSIPSALVQNLKKLTKLDVSFNSIEHLQEQVFEGLRSLRKLNASHNKIRYVDTDVFNPIQDIQSIDLSYNDVIQIFEPYFENNPNLTTLLMRNTWISNTFVDTKTSARSRMEMERLINTLQSVENLDLSDNNMLIIPETLAHIPKLSRVQLQGNLWTCSCDDRWFIAWMTNIILEHHPPSQFQNLWCHSGSRKHPLQDYIRNLHCTDPNIYNKDPRRYYTHMGLHKMLRCHHQRSDGPIITWITPSKQSIRSDMVPSSPSSNSLRSQIKVLDDGNLYISNITRRDFGLYKCIAQYPSFNITHYVHVGVDTTIFSNVRIMSFLIGWAGSFAFLLVVIIVHLVKTVLIKCGVECSTMSKSYQSRRLRTFFESMEQHKSTQLDWLRDNYNMQAKRIKDNCFSQVERIRESYTVQHKNLSDIREYGTNQLHQLRDQYYDQVRRVSGYSAQQLCKVRENYLFQRNRVCKFSSHQLLRLRETYKWQAQTLNKILENLPRTLNLDTCRGIGTCGRTDSIYLEDISEFQSIDESDYPPDSLRVARIPSDKMEHVSLLIPPEFMIPPEHPLELGFGGMMPINPSGTYMVHADPEIYHPCESPTPHHSARMETLQ